MFADMAGENMFVAQYNGKGDYTGISQVFSLVTKICGCIAVVFLAGTLFFPEQLMRILTNEETLIVLGSEYLRVIGISYAILRITITPLIRVLIFTAPQFFMIARKVCAIPENT